MLSRELERKGLLSFTIERQSIFAKYGLKIGKKDGNLSVEAII